MYVLKLFETRISLLKSKNNQKIILNRLPFLASIWVNFFQNLPLIFKNCFINEANFLILSSTSAGSSCRIMDIALNSHTIISILCRYFPSKMFITFINNINRMFSTAIPVFLCHYAPLLTVHQWHGYCRNSSCFVFPSKFIHSVKQA